MPFTKEDKRHLAKWMAHAAPCEHCGGRGGNELWKGLENEVSLHILLVVVLGIDLIHATGGIASEHGLGSSPHMAVLAWTLPKA